MNRTIVGMILTLLALTYFSPAGAQQTGKVYRLGVLSARAAIDPRDEVLRQRLRELGYVEGQNLVIEWRFYEGKSAQEMAMAH